MRHRERLQHYLLFCTSDNYHANAWRGYQSRIRDKVTIMVGGAPVNQAFADSIGADIYTEDAASAADAAAAVLHG